MPVSVVAYDKQWPRRFEVERAALEPVLARWLTGGIHHVGSTAVPGLAAKPILDMVAGIRDIDEAPGAVPGLAGLGYATAPHRPDALWFYRPGLAGPHTHHLHLTEPGSPLWRERLGFRDALRGDPALAREYDELKCQLAAEAGTAAPSYTAGKRPFVARVLASVGVDLTP